MTVDIATDGTSSAARSGADLTDSTGTVIGTVSADVLGSSGSIQANLTAGTYYVHVKPDVFAPHGYQLTVTLPSGTTVQPSTTNSTTISPVFFSNYAGAHSYLRVTNPNATAGTISVTIRDDLGSLLGTWRQQIAANASPQFDVSSIESAAGIAPPTRTGAFARYEIAADFNGLAQQVLWNPQGGSLTALSICDQATSLNSSIVGNVHTSNIGSYPSQVVITNSGTSTTTAAVEVRDSTTGVLIGTWTSPAVSPKGAVSVSEASIEAALKFRPNSVQSHITLRLPSSFTGTIAHYVNNLVAGVITDMTSRCTLTKTTLP